MFYALAKVAYWIYPFLMSQCGELTCSDEHQELGTMFYNDRPCRRLLVFQHQFKAKYVRIHPAVESKSYAERLRTGCRIELLGCVDNGKKSYFWSVQICVQMSETKYAIFTLFVISTKSESKWHGSNINKYRIYHNGTFCRWNLRNMS